MQSNSAGSATRTPTTASNSKAQQQSFSRSDVQNIANNSNEFGQIDGAIGGAFGVLATGTGIGLLGTKYYRTGDLSRQLGAASDQLDGRVKTTANNLSHRWIGTSAQIERLNAHRSELPQNVLTELDKVSASPKVGFLGFHGCDLSVAEKVLSGEERLKWSSNRYDWLGNGIYFWENDPQRALAYARELKEKGRPRRTPIQTPAVVGAVIDLGHCFNLVESSSLELLRKGYDSLVEALRFVGETLPENAVSSDGPDFLVRRLDCAVIEMVHDLMEKETKREYDSVRGVFWEGAELYPTAGFRKKNHIQICVRNPNCIKGYFRPLWND